MKYFALLFCAICSLALAQPTIPTVNEPVQITPTEVQPTLGQDLQELKNMMQLKDLKSLFNLYLLKDAEFQGVIRVLSSYEACLAFRKMKIQPEMTVFRTWLQNEIQRSSVVNSSTNEVNGNLEIINHCSSSVYGWQGFISEFQILYPEYTIRQHIQLKQNQSVSFAEFWQRVRNLRVVFERFLLYPETQHVITLLQEQNVDILHLENFIRTQFDWNVVATPVAPVEPVVEPLEPVEPVEPVEPIVEVEPVVNAEIAPVA